jgi:hypothetical protein
MQLQCSSTGISRRLKDYFKVEKLGNVAADVDLVIFAKEEPDDDAPAHKRAKLSSSSAAAPAAAASRAGSGASAGCLRELTRFPAHNFILDETAYFSTQQVRVLLLCCAACRVLQCDTVALAAGGWTWVSKIAGYSICRDIASTCSGWCRAVGVGNTH